jgi:hypothetical protein
MKKLDFLQRYAGALMVLVLALIIYSCRKDLNSTDPSITDTEVLKAKSWYESTYLKSYDHAATLGANSMVNEADLTTKIKPYWAEASVYTKNGQDVIELPIDPSDKFYSLLKYGDDKRTLGRKEYNRTSYLLLKNGEKYKAYLMTIIADSAYLKNDFSKLENNTYKKHDKDFSGLLLYFTPQGRYLNGYRYNNGKLITSDTSVNPGANNKGINSQGAIAKPNSNIQVECINVWWITEDEQGNITSQTLLYKRCYPTALPGTGGGGVGTPPQCPGGTTGNAYQTHGNTPWEPGPHTPGDDDFPPPTSGSGNCSTTTIEEDDQKDDFTDKIDTSQLSDCFKNVLKLLEEIDNNCVANTIQDFSGDTPGFNWKVKDGSAGGNNAQTNSNYDRASDRVTTEFNTSNFTSGSDLAVAKTLLHESVHAYILAYFATEQNASKSYSQYVDDYYSSKRPDLNETQHNEMVRSFAGSIATLLQQYGQNQGYNLSYQYYNDLAWGGLHETKAFKALSLVDKERILDVINIEQSGKDNNGDSVTPKGKISGC